MIKRGQGLKARVGQRINRHHIAGAQKAHHGHRQPVLGAADDQHVFRVGRKAATGQMAGDSFALGEPPGMRLVAQMRFNIPAIASRLSASRSASPAPAAKDS